MQEDIAASTEKPQFELLIFRKGRLAVSRHAPDPAHTASFAEFTLVRVSCGAFEMVLPFTPATLGSTHPLAPGSPHKLGAQSPDLLEPPPEEVMAVLGAGNGLRPVSSIAPVSHSPTRWDPPLMDRLRQRLSSFSERVAEAI